MMRTSCDLTKANSEGDDRNIAQNGNDRHYWYSVKDMMTLLINARKNHLSYKNYEDDAGEDYCSLRPNDQRLFIADPYHESNFAQYLLDDIDQIIGNGVRTRRSWDDMPAQIVIPLLSGAHWRAIRIEINYVKKTISILWDDPYGEGCFLKKLKDKLIESIIMNASRLISKERLNECTLTTESITEVDKTLDQQGLGSNAWDCGPIIISNILDYIKNVNIKNTHFKEYSIKAISDINHEQQLIDLRNAHVKQYSEISGEHVLNVRLQSLRRDESFVAEDFVHKLESVVHPYQQQVAQLSPSKVNILFTLIETNRRVQQTEKYTELAIKEALDYINQHVIPISLDQHYDEEDFDINSINNLLQKRKSEFNKLLFAIGTDNFAKITESGKNFIDKSLFLLEIMYTGDEVTIITRPRRWGKTTNLDMLAKFFAIEVDEAGNPIKVNRYKDLFQNLRIGREYSHLVAEHQGKYPVIFFTFKNVKANKYKDIEANLVFEIKKLFKKFKYLVNSDKLDQDQKNDLNQYLNGKFGTEGIVRSLEFLSSLLKLHHGMNVYLFIDEYDALLNATYDTEEYENTLKLMRSILGNALKGNENLKKSVVTGITKIAKAGLFSDVNNIREYSILKSRYAEYFGFTGDEVQTLLQQAKITDQKIVNAIKEYYNGYNIGGCIIYNPWSIVNFLTDLELSSYWINTEGSVAGDRKLSTGLLITTQMQEQVRELINNCYEGNKKFVEITISPEVVLHQLRGDVAAIWTILAYGGYLSLSHKLINDDLTETYQARIPNREILGIYKQSISFWFRDVLEVDLAGIKCLNIENIEEFQSVVKKLLLQKATIIGDANESLFHSFIDGLYLLKGNTHLLSSEKKAGSGRIDSIYYPIKGKSEKIIIHEYKILRNTYTMQINAKIQEALWQVYEHFYFQEVVSKFNEFRYSNYQQVEIRGIVAFIDENNNNLGMRSLSVLHTMEETIRMLPFFESLKRDDLIKLKEYYTVNDFVQEYRKLGSLQEVLNQLDPLVEANNQRLRDLSSAIGRQELPRGHPKNTRYREDRASSSRKKAKLGEHYTITPSSYQDKHLTRYEKLLIKQGVFITLAPQCETRFELDRVVQHCGSITFFLEHSHNIHAFYISSLIDMINQNQIIADTIICLERKQYGNNLGMPDVVAIANYLEQGNALPAELQNLPIHYDALLYNVAKVRNIKVMGIEGKGLPYPKESLSYHQAREEYMLYQLSNIIKAGKKAIVLLGAQHASLIQKLVLLESNTNLILIPNYKDVAIPFLTYMYKFVEYLVQDFSWQIQELLYSESKSRFEVLKVKYGVKAPFDVFRGSDSEFRKAVLIKLHPDKNLRIDEASDDFAFVTHLREQLSKPFDVQNFINAQMQSIQSFIYKANIGFKLADTFVDATRLVYVPNLYNAQKALMDVAHIYSMYTGVNGYSALIISCDVINKFSQGEYTKAISQVITSISYMLLPTMLASFGVPCIGFGYSIGLTAYAGYNFVLNAYSFYNEFNQKDFKLNSNIAYQALAETLSATYLQTLYDFTVKAKEYEKTAYKVSLAEKGEFGDKLYEYIYSRVVDEKYHPQNNSKAKHIKVMDYDHCMEIIELKAEESDHYYCYNEEQEILDYIVIVGESYIEKVASL